MQTSTKRVLPNNCRATLASSRPCQHIVNTKSEGVLQLLHTAEDDTVQWLVSTATTTIANELN